MNYLSFNQFLKTYNLKNAPTSNIKLNNVIQKLNLVCKIYMRDEPIIGTNCGIVNLHPIKGTHWVCFFNEFYFDSYGIYPPPQNILNHIKSKFGKCIFIVHIKSRKMTVCVVLIVYIFYTLCQIIGFKKAVLDLYYQTRPILNPY